MAEGSSSAAAMVDAQFTNARILKPFPNFERVYQGKAQQKGIAFPGTRDPRATAGEQNIDPNLMAGIPTPEGSRVFLWFPMCVSPVPPGDAANPFGFYSYTLVWRFRDTGSTSSAARAARTRSVMGHMPQQTLGAPDTTSGTAQRQIIPASWHVIAYEDAAPASGTGNLVIRREKITPRLDTVSDLAQPLLPDGTDGVIQQGVLDPASLGVDSQIALMPMFMPFWTDAEGDELIIIANRETVEAEGTWDFTDPGEDLAFSNVYGTGNGTHAIYPQLGIYVQTGTNP